MSRLTNSIINGTTMMGDRNIGRFSVAPMLDPTYGGQFGWAPALTRWISNQAYVRRNLFCVLLEAPMFFAKMPEGELMVQILKAMFELHAKKIEGFSAGLKVDTSDHPVGGAGEVQQEFTDVKRDRTEPQFTWIEKYGRPFQTFLQLWIQYGIMNPETKYAQVGTFEDYPMDMLADQYSATAIFIEPDPTHRKVMKAWLTTNMYPLSTGDITGERDLTTGGEIQELNITFAGISQVGVGVDMFAQQILNSIVMDGANPFLRPAMLDAISPDVLKADINGYKEGIEELGNVAIPLAGA